MTSGPIGLDLAEVAKSNAPQVLDVPAAPGPENEKNEKTLLIDDNPVYLSDDSRRGPNGEEYPTAEEVENLRRVCGVVPWSAYTIAFVELCERFSYYGTTAVCKFAPRSAASTHSMGTSEIDGIPQSSTSFNILFRMDRRPVRLAPMANRALWVWASGRRPA